MPSRSGASAKQMATSGGSAERMLKKEKGAALSAADGVARDDPGDGAGHDDRGEELVGVGLGHGGDVEVREGVGHKKSVVSS